MYFYRGCKWNRGEGWVGVFFFFLKETCIKIDKWNFSHLVSRVLFFHGLGTSLPGIK